MTGPLVLYESRLNDAAPVASSTAASYDVLNLRDARPYTFWKPAAMPATVTVDCGSAKTADYLAVYGHDLASRGCTIEVRKSTDNFAANDVLVATHTPSADRPILVLFASASSRYWRLRVLTGTAPTIAIALLGNRLEIPAAVREGIDPIGRLVRAQYNRSQAGHPLGKVIRFREWKDTLEFELVSWTWARDTWKAAAEAWLEAEPWLFSWNPDAYPAETWLVSMDGRWSTPHKAGALCNLIVPVVGVLA